MEMDKNSNVILELVNLRQTDYDAFMEKLYELLTGELKQAVYDATPIDEKTEAIWTMIQYFSDKDDFEKCIALKKIKEDLEKTKETGIRQIFA
jgi:hypothetical protein